MVNANFRIVFFVLFFLGEETRHYQ